MQRYDEHGFSYYDYQHLLIVNAPTDKLWYTHREASPSALRARRRTTNTPSQLGFRLSLHDVRDIWSSSFPCT